MLLNRQLGNEAPQPRGLFHFVEPAITVRSGLVKPRGAAANGHARNHGLTDGIQPKGDSRHACRWAGQMTAIHQMAAISAQ
ncbi:hypothetical protein [Burkholderia glumae]|uniref:hypothetical protein n=1 Tax=Burkholderia glumae TaxID=337 RepID=UPI0021511779|nr:hypothetical protein [Burkholderia glumae]